MALKMTGKPSAFGKKLLHIICPGSKPLDGCHCAKMVFGFWDAQLSPPIRTKLAGMSFNKDTYQEMFKLADQAYLANGGSAAPQPPVIGAVSNPSDDLTQNPQVAAASRGRGGRGAGRGGRGGRGRGGNNQSSAPPQNNAASATNANSNQKPHQRGPKHADLPAKATWACAQHWKKGRGAPYCSDPLICQWVNVVAPRTPSTSTST